MKSLILYWSKYGATKACADKLKWYMKGKVDIVNINNDNNISLKDYDIIIIGSPVYIGKFNKKIKKFIEDNKEILMRKRLGLFTSCMSDGDRAMQQFKDNIPKDILECSKLSENFGGELKFSKMNFFEKILIKRIVKKDKNLSYIDGKTDIDRIDDDAIRNFAKVIEE